MLLHYIHGVFRPGDNSSTRKTKVEVARMGLGDFDEYKLSNRVKSVLGGA